MSEPTPATSPAPVIVSLPHWRDPDFISAMIDGTPFPHELEITSQNQALASIVHAVLSRRGYTITGDLFDPLTVHARTMQHSAPLPS